MSFKLFQGIASHLEKNIKLDSSSPRKYGFDVLERPKMAESNSAVASRLLLFYQMERIVDFMQVRSTSSNQTLVYLSTFRAVLKQILVRDCFYHIDRPRMYWFEVTLAFGEKENGQLQSSTRYTNRKSILDCKLFIRVRSVLDNHMRNDKLLLSDILSMYPHLGKKMESGDFSYSDLVRTGERMYKQFRRLYTNGISEKSVSSTEDLADFLDVGKVHRIQKPISKIYGISERFFSQDYPILLHRGPITAMPRRVAAVILLDKTTVQFLVYEMNSSKTHSMVKSLDWVKVQLPFFDQLMLEGSRIELGKRLLLIAKNPLLIDIHTKGLTE